MDMLTEEGDEWSCYHQPEVWESYARLLASSITYVAEEDGLICGYFRSLQDGDFYLYGCDLLVRPAYRGQGIGRMLMECLYRDYPGMTVYVMSDVDGYYAKLGYHREGSIFEVSNPDAE